jgi:hypothetical protein
VDVTASGHSFVVQFEGRRVLFRFRGIQSAWKLRQLELPFTATLLRALEFLDIAIDAQIASWQQIRLFPNPGPFTRQFLPGKFRVQDQGEAAN